jgi:hypothetical protein
MAPQEKAQQLVDKYSMITKWKMGVEQEYVIKKAKECAIIAVDEMKTSLFNNDLMYMYDYWLEVKKEIEKL